eukprot:13828909-Alexandrium_andersonii.AAC.1
MRETAGRKPAPAGPTVHRERGAVASSPWQAQLRPGRQGPWLAVCARPLRATNVLHLLRKPGSTCAPGGARGRDGSHGRPSGRRI